MLFNKSAVSLIFTLVLGVVALGSSSVSAAWPPKCASLSPGDQERAKSLMKRIYPHDCCDSNLATCLQAASPSRLVVRLASGVCNRISLGDSDDTIVREMEKRGASMTATAVARIDTSDVVWAGDPKAPVTVIVYACGRCPFCARSVPEMYDEVTNGNLKGKARLGFRIYPVKSHPGSKEAGLAFETARQMGGFWPYVLRAYDKFDEFTVDELYVWSVLVGLDVDRFVRLMDTDGVYEKVVESKKEGLRNKVESTPTYFINGKLFQGDMKTWSLVCAILEEYDRMNGNLCKP